MKDRLEYDLSLSHHPLRKDSNGFLTHTVRLVEPFKIVDCGPSTKENRRYKNVSSNGSQSGNQIDVKDKKEKVIRVTDFLWEPNRQKGLRQFLKDCCGCPDDKKKLKLAERAKERCKNGLYKSTRGQIPSKSHYPFTNKPTTGRLPTLAINLSGSPSCPIVVSDGTKSLNGSGHFHDGSDDTTP